jgi:hypothetical protein
VNDGSGLSKARWQYQPTTSDHADITNVLTLESVATNLDSAYDLANRTATAYSTATISFVEGRLYLLGLRGRTATTEPLIGSVAGGGNTWTLLQTVNVSNVTIWLYYAVAVSTTTDTIDITPDGITTWTQAGWVVDEVITPIASPIVQSAQNNDTASHTSLTVTLASFADATENIAYGFFAQNATNALVPGSGLSELGAAANSTENANLLMSVWRVGQDTGVDVTTASTTDDISGIAVEIAMVESDVVVAPDTLDLTLTTFAPTVSVSDNKNVAPDPASLVITTFAPSVVIGFNVAPTTAALVITTFAPAVTVTDNKVVAPDTASLVITGFAPTVFASDNKNVAPDAASLVITGFAPTVAVSDNQIVAPGTLSLVITTFAPTVAVSDNQFVSPTTAALVITTYAPTIVQIIPVPGYVRLRATVPVMALSATIPSMALQETAPAMELSEVAPAMELSETAPSMELRAVLA